MCLFCKIILLNSNDLLMAYVILNHNTGTINCIAHPSPRPFSLHHYLRIFTYLVEYRLHKGTIYHQFFSSTCRSCWQNIFTVLHSVSISSKLVSCSSSKIFNSRQIRLATKFEIISRRAFNTDFFHDAIFSPPSIGELPNFLKLGSYHSGTAGFK